MGLVPLRTHQVLPLVFPLLRHRLLLPGDLDSLKPIRLRESTSSHSHLQRMVYSAMVVVVNEKENEPTGLSHKSLWSTTYLKSTHQEVPLELPSLDSLVFTHYENDEALHSFEHLLDLYEDFLIGILSYYT